MQPHDTYGPPMTQDDTTKSRCVMRQVTAESRLARRMTQMTQNCTIYASRARPRMRTRMTKSCFSVTFASCVIGGDSTLWPTRHVGPCRDRSRDAQTGHLVGRSPQTPTWAAWAATVATEGTLRAAANRYLEGKNGPRRQREQPQSPSDLLPVDRTATQRFARGPRRSPTLATGRVVAVSPRPDRRSPHGPTWAAVVANRHRPVHPAPAWRHVP